MIRVSHWPGKRLSPLLGFGLAAATLLICFGVSLALGSVQIDLNTILTALLAADGSREHLIIRTIRLPRALIATLVGASLAVAGAIMQGLTRNPLASPGILGINAGAALAVVLALFGLGSGSLLSHTGFAFLGAGLAALSVYGLGSAGRGGPTPLKLTLAGAALTAFLSSVTTGILILNQQTLEEIRFWLAGSIAGRDLQLFWQTLPFMAVGLMGAFLLGRQITTLSLGEETAQGLGQEVGRIKGIAAGIVVLLAGGAVSVAGPIGFIGLIVPHCVRFFIRTDYRWILPFSAVVGAIVLLCADVGARLLIPPQEVPVGVMTGLVGAPFFVYLARWKVRR